MTGRMKRIAAAAAIAYPLIQMTAQGFMQVGGMEPSFSAGGVEILGFFEARDRTLFEIGGLFHIFSEIAFLWFLGALWDTLHREEGGTGWLAWIAAASGIPTVIGLADGSWYLAFFRVPDGLNTEMARLLFDQGNLTFANSWVTLGSMVLAASLAFLNGKRYPKWFGWFGAVLSIFLILARAVWTSPIAFAPYSFFWVWMITFGVLALRRVTNSQAAESERMHDLNINNAQEELH